jgi:predicted DNA-binding transcriptional regulator AlpA
MTENNDQPLTHGEAARFVGVSTSTFKKVLASGQGPTPTQIGERKKYRPSVLRDWIEARTAESGDE